MVWLAIRKVVAGTLMPGELVSLLLYGLMLIRPVSLDGLSLFIRAGETVALTGENGTGKSTLAHLLTRFHEPQGGAIRIDGVDVPSVSLRSLRRNVGLLPQHALLFNGTVRENIAYGEAEPSDAAVEQADCPGRLSPRLHHAAHARLRHSDRRPEGFACPADSANASPWHGRA
jgi:ABC-type uncharacterized transport system ATPase component